MIKGFFKKIIVFLSSVLVFALIPTTIATWTNENSKTPVGEVANLTPTIHEPQAYIAGSTKIYYDTIPHALNAATSGNIVVAVPAEKKNYHSSNNNVANSAIDKKVYTITEDCEIKSGVTLIIPTDTDTISSVTNSSTLTDYINSMKEDDHSRGSGYGSFATSNEARFLRVTVNIASNVELINNGTLVVSGYQNCGTSSGGLVGGTSHSYSKIVLGTNAKITQNNSGANTYCFGYISEESSNNSSLVSINSGKLYVPFILRDYRGFSFSWAMTYNSNEALSSYKCSAFNQFEFRNIDSLLNIKYGATVYGDITVYLSYPSQDVDECFSKELGIVGTSTSFLCQLTNTTYSSLSYKYNKSTEVAKIIFYGGMTLNSISLTISKSVLLFTITVNLSTGSAYLPLSYRQNIELSKAEGQSSATFDFNNQMIKVLPGSEIIINSGATLTGKSLVCYSSFYDGSLGNGYSSVNGYNSFKYPVKNAGVVKVMSGGHLTCSTSIAGTIYGDSANLTTPSTTSITANEAWCLAGSGSASPAWKITDYLQLNETLQLLPITDNSKQKICVGLNTFKNYNSYKPRIQLILNPGASGEETINVYDNQKVIHTTGVSTYKLEFINNVYKAYKSTSSYSKNEVVNYSTSNSNCCAVNSTMSISNNNGGINEFNAQSVSVICTTPLVDGNIPLYPESSIQLLASVVDIDKVYNKAITWSSSDTSIATVNQSGTVVGVALGPVRISAECDGVVGFIDLEVIEETSPILPIESIYIADNSGHTSQNDPTVQASDGSFLAHAQYSNGTNVTFTVVINPSEAPYQSISWHFHASAVGRQYVNDKTQQDETITNASSVVVHIVSGSGADDDACYIECTVVDLLGNTRKSKFVINHKKDTSICLAEGTMIMMADGTEKDVKDVVPGDVVMVFNHETGNFDYSVVTINDHMDVGYELRNVLYLNFSNGKVIKVIGEHGFIDTIDRKYHYIDEYNYRDYIGHDFYNLDYDSEADNHVGTARLISAYVIEEMVNYFSPASYFHLNIIAEGFISMPGAIRGLFNIFELDETLQYDQAQKQQDIETYGLLTYEDAQLIAPGISEELFYAFPAIYYKVAVGKGITTWEEIMRLTYKYTDYENPNEP